MMNILNLLWIIPLSAFFGFMVCACLSVASDANREFEKTEKAEVEV